MMMMMLLLLVVVVVVVVFTIDVVAVAFALVVEAVLVLVVTFGKAAKAPIELKAPSSLPVPEGSLSALLRVGSAPAVAPAPAALEEEPRSRSPRRCSKGIFFLAKLSEKSKEMFEHLFVVEVVFDLSMLASFEHFQSTIETSNFAASSLGRHCQKAASCKRAATGGTSKGRNWWCDTLGKSQNIEQVSSVS